MKPSESDTSGTQRSNRFEAEKFRGVGDLSSMENQREIVAIAWYRGADKSFEVSRDHEKENVSNILTSIHKITDTH